MAGEQDTELTLSTGKLLMLFFGLVVVCGIFFSLGYAVGKNSTPGASTVVLDSSTVAPVQTAGVAKPAAGKPAVNDPSGCGSTDVNCQPAPAVVDASAAAQPTPDTSVQKSLQQNTIDPQLTAPEKPAATITAPELQGAAGAGFMVQVAAVSKQEDADALVSALRKKEYPVFVVPNPGSKLFHVQVGPFAAQKDADAMRQKLANDGYNAFVKK